MFMSVMSTVHFSMYLLRHELMVVTRHTCLCQAENAEVVSYHLPHLLEYKSQLHHLFLLLLSRGASYTPNITSFAPYIRMYSIIIWKSNFMQYVLGVRLVLGCDLYSSK